MSASGMAASASATRTSGGSCSGRFRRLQKCSYGPSGHLSLMRLHQIACSIVGSRLDYCNSLLPNCSNRNLDKLQRMQNNMACVVCNSSRLTPAEPLLQSLHWLPVRQRINYKLANLCYLAVSHHQPVYLAHLIRPYIVSRVRYDHQHKVFFPFPRKTWTLLLVVSLSRHKDSGTLFH